MQTDKYSVTIIHEPGKEAIIRLNDESFWETYPLMELKLSPHFGLERINEISLALIDAFNTGAQLYAENTLPELRVTTSRIDFLIEKPEISDLKDFEKEGFEDFVPLEDPDDEPYYFHTFKEDD